MKKLVLSIATLSIMSGLFAQQKEIDAAYSAYESKNYSAAKAELSKVSNQINSITLSPELKAKYYFVSGQLALQEGKSIDAAKQFGEMGKFENGVVYSLKNKSTKNTEYYPTRAEAEKAYNSGSYSKVKEENLQPNFLKQVHEDLLKKAESSLKDAQDAIAADNNSLAGDKFLEAAYLAQAIGGDPDLFKYNAAISYHKDDKFQKALDIYKELIKDNYTGENSQWVALDAKTGKEVSFNTKAEGELQQKLNVVKNLREEKSASIETDLFAYTLGALVELKMYDPLVETISAKYPNNTKIQGLASTVYHNSGKEDMFLEKLIANTKLDPNDHLNYFNIGVLYMNKNEDAKALEYFDKAIKANPQYKSAYTQAALIKVKPEKEYIEKINANLGASAKEKQVYKEYTAKRKALYMEAIPYLEKAFEIDKTDAESAKILRQAYQAAEMYDKEDQMRAIEKSLN